MDLAQLRQRYEPKKIAEFKAAPQLCTVRYNPSGKLLCAGGFNGQVRRFDASEGELKELAPLTGHSGWVHDVAFSPAGETLYAADSWGGLIAWDYVGDAPQPRWKNAAAHRDWIRALAVSPDGTTLATAGGATSRGDLTIRLWNTADGAAVGELLGHEHVIHNLLFHPQHNQTLVSGDLLGCVRQWDLTTKQAARTFDAQALFKEDRLQEIGGPRAICFSHDGGLLVVAGVKPANGGTVVGTPTVLVFDFASGELKQNLEFGTSNDVFVHDIRFHRDGFLMAVTSGQPGSGKLVFRRLEDQAAFFETSAVANCHALAVHPAGRRLVIAATNGGSNGNGRQLDKDGNYPDNWTPLVTWEIPA